MENAEKAGTPITTAEVKAPKLPKAKAKGGKAKTKVARMGSKDFAAKFREGTIGRLTVDLIVAGKMTNDEILKAVKTKHRDAETTSACVAWYRSKARNAGVIE